MDDLDLVWLIPTAFQVIGLAIALSVLGFVYGHANRERNSFASVLMQGHMVKWLVLAGVIFAAGVSVSRISWEYKTVAVVLAVHPDRTSPGHLHRTNYVM